MRTKNLAIFMVIVLLIVFSAYITAFGLPLGNYSIVPAKDIIRLGLDLRGGATVLLEAKDNPNDPVNDEKMDRAIATIRERVDSLGVAEPSIVKQGSKRIEVQLPEIQDTQRALEVIGQTAQLEFKDEAGNVIITGADIKDAKAVQTQDPTSPYVVSFDLKPEGAKKFAEGTKNNIGKTIGIYLDDKMISNPLVKDPITNGEAQITGSSTREEALDLATLIRAGALPVDLEVLSVTAVGPQLGANSFEKSLFAGAIGIALVMIFMLVYYRLPGLIADIALVLYTVITLAAMAGINATLTLPGIAGLILSVGMAVDTNVIIFERIKEEIRVGKTLRAAIDAGFRRAFLTIIDSNITTLLAGIILFYFGSGPIKGFAVTLSIGIVASMFTAITVTKYLMVLLVRSGVESKWMYGVREGKSMRVFDFMKYRKIWFSISGIILALGLIFFIISGGLNYGIDYTGGSSIQIDFGKEFDIEKVRDVMAKFDENAIVTYAGNDYELALIKTNLGFDVEKQGEIKAAFKESLGVEETNIEINYIGPSIGDELKKQALIALLLANIGILIYVSLRFEWKIGLSAIVALVHDVLVMITVFAIFQIPVTSSFLAALLTIIGYSINDTIVIFDRVRENLKSTKRMSDEELVNLSTTQSLSRSINTSATTLVTVLALYILGVPAIRDFAFPMMVGIISGVYSTIFIASPVWVMLRKRAKTAASH